jgi:hypothetical protein
MQMQMQHIQSVTRSRPRPCHPRFHQTRSACSSPRVIVRHATSPRVTVRHTTSPRVIVRHTTSPRASTCQHVSACRIIHAFNWSNWAQYWPSVTVDGSIRLTIESGNQLGGAEWRREPAGRTSGWVRAPVNMMSGMRRAGAVPLGGCCATWRMLCHLENAVPLGGCCAT